LKPNTLKRLVNLSAVASLWFGSVSLAADQAVSQQANQQKAAAPGDSNRIELEDAVLKLIVIPRTREQMKAFYEGRGFPKQAIGAIAEACFMTVIVKNKTDNVLWLELDNWRINGAADIKRLDRAYWKQRWESLNVPMSNQSTFGWTLLPERRDLRADEGVGGNITLVYSKLPFTLNARFYQGADKQGGPHTVQLDQLQCIR
jgi:hypothetical protein